MEQLILKIFINFNLYWSISITIIERENINFNYKSLQAEINIKKLYTDWQIKKYKKLYKWREKYT